MSGQTLMAPLGGEIYQEVFDRQGNRIVLTYNDLWMLIVCRTSMDGDWIRARQAAGMVMDPSHKQNLAERLWELEQMLGGLPEIPPGVQTLHLQRAHHWFKGRPVLFDRQW
jgi:hypothetical protein